MAQGCQGRMLHSMSRGFAATKLKRLEINASRCNTLATWDWLD